MIVADASTARAFEQSENAYEEKKAMLEREDEEAREKKATALKAKMAKKILAGKGKSSGKEELTPEVAEKSSTEGDGKLSEVPAPAVGEKLGYFGKLKNAMKCFISFYNAVLRSRFNRDDQFLACANQGNLKCETAINSKNEEKVTGLVTEFNRCLETP